MPTEHNTHKVEMPENNTVVTDGGEDEEVWKSMSFYLKEDTHLTLKRWFKQFELDHMIAEKADRREQHEVMVQFIMDNEDEIVAALEDYLNN